MVMGPGERITTLPRTQTTVLLCSKNRKVGSPVRAIGETSNFFNLTNNSLDEDGGEGGVPPPFPILNYIHVTYCVYMYKNNGQIILKSLLLYYTSYNKNARTKAK